MFWYLFQSLALKQKGKETIGIVAGINFKQCTRKRLIGGDRKKQEFGIFFFGCTDGQQSDSVGVFFFRGAVRVEKVREAEAARVLDYTDW